MAAPNLIWVHGPSGPGDVMTNGGEPREVPRPLNLSGTSAASGGDKGLREPAAKHQLIWARARSGPHDQAARCSLELPTVDHASSPSSRRV